MAVATYINGEIAADGGSSVDFITAAAPSGNRVVARMNFCFHGVALARHLAPIKKSAKSTRTNTKFKPKTLL